MITIVDYKAGNLTSVKRALDHLGITSQISANPDVVRKAEQIIFPGVGAAGSAIEVLRERKLDSALKESFQRGDSCPRHLHRLPDHPDPFRRG
jgi:imidazole glycerol-phosphate synthase subunit HisH